jgi:DNA polymerase III delta prime subunit
MNTGVDGKMPNNADNDFLENLVQLRERVLNQLSFASRIMERFKAPTIKEGFVDQRPIPAKRGPHITSTTQCLRAIFQIPYLSDLSKEFYASSNEILDFFQNNEWQSAGIGQFNIHSAPQCLLILQKLGVRRENNKKIDEAIRSIASDLTCLLEGKSFRDEVKGIDHAHGFILYWTTRALTAYWEELEDPKEVDVFNKTLVYVENSLYKQLAYYSSGDSRFDVGNLAYYLATILESKGLLSSSIIKHTLDIILSTKMEDIPKLTKSFLHTKEGLTMFPMSIEVPCMAMQALKTQKEELMIKLMRSHFSQIENALTWVELNHMVIEHPNGKEVKKFEGWRSDRHRAEERSVQSWASALVFEFLYSLLLVVQSCIKEILLRELNAKFVPSKDWNELPDYKIDDKIGIKEVLEKNIIQPIATSKNPPYEKCGIILFGPPRTGKNTIVYALARRLNWKIIYLTPKDFLLKGPDNIIQVADGIFRKLFLLEDVVIFFDEFDTLVVHRMETRKEKEEIEKIEDFLTKSFTASLLQWLDTLKKLGKSIFILCTNYPQKFETAAVGRFDLILPVGPPRIEEKKKMMKNLCGNHLTDGEIDNIVSTMDEKMVWSEIEEICKFANAVRKEKEKMTLIMKKVADLNRHLIVKENPDMRMFRENIQMCRGLE